MNRWLTWLVLACLAASFARRCPAPIIYRPGEGWTYEPVGSAGRWRRNRAREQLQVAQESFDKGEYRTALKAARRTVKVWPLSDYAGPAQYLVGRTYEARKYDERAFREYQRALTRYPKLPNYEEVLQRQMAIATRFLGGQWFKLWGYIPFFPSMDKTSKFFEEIVRHGPFHSTGPQAQMAAGAAREKQKNYPAAVRAYEKAADRYFDRPAVASDALFKAGSAWTKQSKRAEYDQSASVSAIDTFNDFKALYPNDKRTAEATDTILQLKTEQARGAFQTARFYEKYRKYQGALVYYNEVIVKDPKSPFAEPARQRIEELKPRAARQAEIQKRRDELVRTATKGLAARDRAEEEERRARREAKEKKAQSGTPAAPTPP
ncbi:MAG: outer membrane protein assembly factor BamD, partial [Verrucomicrobiota bacterium]